MFPAEEIKLSKIGNRSTVILQCKETFTDMLQTSLSSARAFEKDNAVRFVDAFLMGIVEDLMSSKVLDRSFTT